MSGEVLHGFSCEFVQEGDSCKLLDVLLAENAELREECRTYQRTIDDLVDESGVYMDENIELRELMRDLYEMAYPERPSAFEAAFADRMRELGVEVDG